MALGQVEKTSFPHVKGLVKKRTKFGHRYILTDKDSTGKSRSITVKISDNDPVDIFMQKVTEARTKIKAQTPAETLEERINEFACFQKLSPNTTALYRHSLSGFTLDEKANQQKVNEILKRNLKPSTISLYLRHVRHFFDWLIRRGVQVKNPIADVSFKSKTMPRSRIPTQEEIDRILSYARNRDPMYLLFILLLINTGARVSTLFALRKSDLKDGFLLLYNAKCHKYYDYSIPIQSKEIINLWEKCPGDEPIFARNGRVYWRRINQWMRRNLGCDSKGETISAHSMRHAFATRAAMNNVPIEIIAKLLDHQSIATTAKFYARFSQKQINDAVSLALGHSGSGSPSSP